MRKKTYYYYDEDLDAIGECDETNVEVIEDCLAYGDFQVFDCLCDAEEKMGWEREYRKEKRKKSLSLASVNQAFDQIYYMK